MHCGSCLPHFSSAPFLWLPTRYYHALSRHPASFIPGLPCLGSVVVRCFVFTFHPYGPLPGHLQAYDLAHTTRVLSFRACVERGVSLSSLRFSCSFFCAFTRYFCHPSVLPYGRHEIHHPMPPSYPSHVVSYSCPPIGSCPLEVPLRHRSAPHRLLLECYFSRVWLRLAPLAPPSCALGLPLPCSYVPNYL